MCGIVGAVAQRDVVPILLEGLRRLEYRGYDSAGMAVVDSEATLQRVRRTGKVAKLEQGLLDTGLTGSIGIAHTRWATHGKPSEANAHPHICRQKIAIVHNGIIENYEELKVRQQELGFEFTSQTDTEVIVHQIYHYLEKDSDLLIAVKHTLKDLKGAYSLGVISTQDPNYLIAARQGSPLVVGIGIGEHFIASDVAALLPVTQRFIFLEEGDVVELSRGRIRIYDITDQVIDRPIRESELQVDVAEKGQFRHYMLKEIFEQPRAISETLEGRINGHQVLDESFGVDAKEVLNQTQSVLILACGTSYHAGMTARYWLESIAHIPCQVEIASEFRYRSPVVTPNTLVVALSQSGETADTIAALKEAKRLGFRFSLSICNVLESSLVRESDLALMTRAGPEIGVASTKAFTAQLVALLLLVIVLGRRRQLTSEKEANLVSQLIALPANIEQALQLNSAIQTLSEQFAEIRNVLFLGRGVHYPIAMEGALKLKEISYIHAESYPAGELKHGPLALVDTDTPVIAVAPNDQLLEKLKSNLQEVRARGGQLYIFADHGAQVSPGPGMQVLEMLPIENETAPIVHTIPLQLLAYHVAIIKGTDVDQPRNLAKSVTVE
ncbi:glutamine--fructose-6-phosphate transaminase (isomerizing) [Candidatus Nitrosacidococcus tergens]|uniref:Glutamine--fructose-6-phosphate aminotransferase [isomerizing] n=1 Tax=Candidatus Nitrosacidococcus tergens TaxID=553981 RepID=A0A7G1QCX5_9GAMM|nr:glutamine--fructose-6-phosphate transaminase (isomerizing) [Candidatus Nitrosacidococcus tergens]CAB1277625.1 L-glutamine:D-fructose-6-phosphate aminotransferase [Candidatus Nitrosacidococcus tergens]